jgi:hypothetical protein
VHRESRSTFVCSFGLTNPDEAGNPLFLEATGAAGS